jgi:hypothetical protein
MRGVVLWHGVRGVYFHLWNIPPMMADACVLGFVFGVMVAWMWSIKR